MEFTEKDASAFARLCKGKKAKVLETRRLLEKRSRHLMEQSALLKHDINMFKNNLAAIDIHDYLTGVAHVCECYPLCPTVWSLLPVELLQRVFARLPFPDIMRLRVLSKTWDRYVIGVTPGFTKLCAERSPYMFALISDHFNGRIFNKRMDIQAYDSKEKRWHHFRHDGWDLETGYTQFAGDGGLVCFVCRGDIVVYNPLTGQWRKLPSPPPLRDFSPSMVLLVMDRDSKCYKVLVVGLGIQGNLTGWIFSSAIGKWSEPNIFSDLIFGCHSSPTLRKSLDHGPSAYDCAYPCAYDCASNTLLELEDGSYPCKSWGEKRVFVKDRLFVLHTYDHHEYLLTEYQAQSCQPHWIRVKVYECLELDETVPSFPGDMDLEMRLFGCQDFLVVMVHVLGDYVDDEDPRKIRKRTLLFDLSTSQWQIISEIREWCIDDYPDDCMFELQWDAVP